jgi:vacuolar-type H+-ATPase subunit C/Vma6
MQIETINIVNEVRAQKGNIKFEPLPAGKKNGNGKKRSRFARKKAATKDIEKAMRAEMLAQSTKMLHEYRRNIKPIIGYFIAKENEIRNIRLIVRGKQYALPQEMIEEHLVI